MAGSIDMSKAKGKKSRMSRLGFRLLLHLFGNLFYIESIGHIGGVLLVPHLIIDV